MKSLFEKFVQPLFEQPADNTTEMAIDLATAVLLVEVSRADFDQDQAEMETIRELLLSRLEVDPNQVDQLLTQAQLESDNLVSVQHITRLMNERMSQAQKRRVIELMWEVVYADGEKHHYEEHLMRQIAELLYVSHEDFIRARHRAEGHA